MGKAAGPKIIGRCNCRLSELLNTDSVLMCTNCYSHKSPKALIALGVMQQTAYWELTCWNRSTVRQR